MRLQGGLQGLACVTLLASGAATAQAPELARAMTLQPPVWVERGEQRKPLRPGATVFPGDRISTGAGGRLHLELEDSSTIKLGEGADFAMPALQVIDDGSDTGLLKGVLKLAKGAFRFTTGALAQFRKRDLDVHIGPTVTTGIRGTDVFGKSDDTQDLLCLLEGSVQVWSPDTPAQTMDQPRTFYVVPRGQPPKPISPTPQDKLDSWLPSTEMRPQEAALNAGGRYRLVLLSVGTEKQAAGEAARLAALGYPVDVLASETPTGPRHRVVLGGFARYEDAQQYRGIVSERLRISGSWVMRP
ncbi:FecR family protein [Solimonas sp. SE-A11]|uniref:FecR family protein n=1 Tax=Solimonas sp. SE-A11 TaxID=3054954 RepID=UPI00259CCDB8|nr:FecR family protein [Solimonas sp. SE-A11]MDM4770004.1 FecR family protein [Solimonas sp. SE-A11]